MRSYSTLAAATSRLRAQTINMRLPAVMAPIKLPMRAGIIAQMRCLRAAPADGPDDRLCVDAGDTDELCNGVLNKMAGVAATPIEEVSMWPILSSPVLLPRISSERVGGLLL
eukprot:SAG31_NODE_1184_length_9496_cov_7.198680_1_plen_112_part_00